jgi:hypothetical protein
MIKGVILVFCILLVSCSSEREPSEREQGTATPKVKLAYDDPLLGYYSIGAKGSFIFEPDKFTMTFNGEKEQGRYKSADSINGYVLQFDGGEIPILRRTVNNKSYFMIDLGLSRYVLHKAKVDLNGDLSIFQGGWSTMTGDERFAFLKNVITKYSTSMSSYVTGAKFIDDNIVYIRTNSVVSFQEDHIFLEFIDDNIIYVSGGDYDTSTGITQISRRAWHDLYYRLTYTDESSKASDKIFNSKPKQVNSVNSLQLTAEIPNSHKYENDTLSYSNLLTSEKQLVDSAIESYLQKLYSEGTYLERENCVDWELIENSKKMLYGIREYKYISIGDLNNDAKDDVIFSFSVYVCPGGNFELTETVLFFDYKSAGVRYNDTYRDSIVRNINKLVDDAPGSGYFKRVEDNIIYIEYYGYADSDSRCCPSHHLFFQATYPDTIPKYIGRQKIVYNN